MKSLQYFLKRVVFGLFSLEILLLKFIKNLVPFLKYIVCSYLKQLYSNMIHKSWIGKPIRSNEFSDGVVQFLDFAFSNASINDYFLCPCIICEFSVMCNTAEVFSHLHLLQKGFPEKYTCWYMHGEQHIQSNVESIPRVQNESVR